MYDTKDPRKSKAIALTYEASEVAPRVIASGSGYIAERIIERAKEEKIPIHEDPLLANSLSQLEIGEYIPPELYQVIAEILTFVDSMDHIKSKVMPQK